MSDIRTAVSLVSNEIYTEAISVLRNIVPDSQKKLDNTDLLNMCWRMLPTK